MEIMIKAKQKYNPFFSFVSLYDPLHTYYRHLLQMIASGKYSPKQQAVKDGEEVEKSEVGGGVIGGERDGVRRPGRKGARKVSETGEDESDPEDSDEEFELHPLLRLSTTPRSSPKPPSTSNPRSTTATPSASNATTRSNDHRHPAPPLTDASTSVPPSSAMPSFYSKSLTVNSAPSLEREQRDVVSSHGGSYPYPSSSSER